MADGWDVTARLAAGAPAVEHTAAFVGACHQLGYQHPDLTMHAAQVRDWYGQDDGLDLRALDADRAALSAVAAAADDAVRRHGDLTAQLVGAWSGGGSASAGEFLRRHGESADAVRAGLHRAVDAVAALRDELWRAVDTKVDAVQDIDDRSLAQRAEWLAAAQTVTTGAGDRAAASELVDQQVKPFVDNDIRSDWVAAMRQAAASATAAYDAAIAKLDTAPASFDVPGEMGPRWAEPSAPPTASETASVPTSTTLAAATTPAPAAAPNWQPTESMPAPAAATAPLSAAPPPVDPLLATASQPSTATPSPMPSLGDLGGGMPSLGTSGFGQQLADLIGGLVGSSEGLTPDEPEIDPAEDIGDEADDDLGDESEEDTEPAGAAEESDEEPTDEEPTEEEQVPSDETAVDPEPPPAETPVPPPPSEPPVPPAIPEALPQEKTPCEIAADELPQVGE